MLDENLSLLEIAKKITGDEDVKVLEENITQFMNVIAQKNICQKD